MKDQDWLILSIMNKNNSLTKAADALFMSQPALSKRLYLIEKELGVTIVQRTSQGIIFTPEGELLVQKAEEHLKWMNKLQSQLKSVKNTEKTTFKIGMSHSIIRFYFPQIQKNYEKIQKDVKFDISYFKSSEVVKLVENNKIDIGLIRGNHAYTGNKYLFALDYGYVISSQPISMEGLPKITEIDYERDPSLYKLINKWWNQNFSEPSCNKTIVPNVDISREMVLKGLGFSINFTPNNFYNNTQLFSMPMYWKDGNPVHHPSWIVCNPENEKIPAIKSFIDFAIQNSPLMNSNS
jgi:DNA-binding transcriptional LysR family regulator